jgi:TnpA family transposase
LVSIQETAYPRLKSSYSKKELDDVYTPTPAELEWMTQSAKSPVSKLGLMVSLKVSQRLGYFVTITDVPTCIIEHVARLVGVPSISLEALKLYSDSGTCRRHHSLIRNYRNIRFFDMSSRQIMLEAMTEAALTKDDPADLINVAIEKLVRQHYELPAFSALAKAADHVQAKSYRELYEKIYKLLDANARNIIDNLFQRTSSQSPHTPWHQIKQDPSSPTLTHLKNLVAHHEWLSEMNIGTRALQGIPLAKVKQIAAEAKTLDASRMSEIEPKKRCALATALLAVQSTQVMDDIGEMLIKRMMSIHKKGKQSLEKYRLQKQKRTDELVATLRDLLTAYQTEGSAEERVYALERVIGNRGDAVLEDCETHLAFSGNNYYPFLWQHFKSHRPTLFKILQVVCLRSTSQDKLMEQAIEFLQSHQYSRADWIPTDRIERDGKSKNDWKTTPMLDLSWVPDSWWRWISPQSKRGPFPEEIHRRRFEVCVFSQIMWELKSGDLYIKGSEKYADYREQLISWDEYHQSIEEFCEQVGIPTKGHSFVERIQSELASVAKVTDSSFPRNEHIRIEKGEAVLSPLKKQSVPEGLRNLERYIGKNLEPINILDVLYDTEYWLNWTQFFGPISGHDAKLENPVQRYLTTVFSYGCNLGPTQTAWSLGNVDRRQIAWINQRHITEETLELAIRHVINSYNKFILPKYWGTGKRASADGTKWDLYEQNLLTEYHIRYGGYGGIGYYHISDTYIALFSHFIPCGVWEGVYILDILLKNKSDIQPDTLHADTQGQSTTIFGLSYLLGIELMPRIRNWKDLQFHRPNKNINYQHIDELFSSTVDWDLIETHFPDMLRVAMSIRAGRITPSTILNKLGTYSRKNRLYQAFRELGLAIRTKFLLKYISDEELRRTIQEATNKSEAFNGFTKWLFFGGKGIIGENDRERQRKIIKYNHLVSNCLIFYNVFALTRILHNYTQMKNSLDIEVISDLSPYITAHVNRFGKYRFDSNRHPPALEFNVPIV